MFALMVLMHLLADYVFQFDRLARWKARSLWGVVAHGAIVTLTTLLGTFLVAPAWWCNALLIGVAHTVIDIVKAHLIRAKNAGGELLLFLGDQTAHLAIIALLVNARPVTLVSCSGSLSKVIALAIGYLLLLQPAWVLLRFIVRGIWGAEAAPQLSLGEKYEPMVERVLIASFVLVGQTALVPLVLLPRRLTAVTMQSNGIGFLVQLTAHWAETLLSVLLAIGVGLFLRIVVLGG